MYNDDDDNDNQSDDNSDNDQNDTSGNDSSDDNSNDDNSSDNAQSGNVEDHRAAIGDALSQAADRQGVTLTDLASRIGLSSDDVNELTHDDLVTAAKHLASEHPDLVDSFIDRVPMGNVFGGFVKSFLNR